eukprot:TRINITY_DN12950_c0_g1_i1.p1 TRINITY_DN12950_c0_g1~~TRINITY_DN12950_c0_g1_i1.p1  ORF type:complete len:325 (-),score=50.49 TRINITY_DN12950_c0_g1_i1:137-1111(-)
MGGHEDNTAAVIAKQFFAGSIAGLIGDGSVHPVDTIRTRLQVQRGNDGMYKNTAQSLRLILKQEGWRALYNGFGIVALFTVPAHALYFVSYEKTKALLANPETGKSGALAHFSAGLVADVVGASIWNPMDVVKQRLQLQKKMMEKGTTGTATLKYRGSIHALNTIVKEEGVSGLYRGFGAGLATYGPYVGIYWMLYEQCKSWTVTMLNNRDEGVKSSAAVAVTSSTDSEDALLFPHHLACGVVASAVAAAVTTPLDVIKTRLQVQHVGCEGERYKNGMDVLRATLKEEGLSAFKKGIGARVMWIVPGTAISVAVYEKFKRVLGV